MERYFYSMKMSLLLTSPRPLRLAVILTNVPIVNVIQWGAFHTDYGAVRFRGEPDIFHVIEPHRSKAKADAQYAHLASGTPGVEQ